MHKIANMTYNDKISMQTCHDTMRYSRSFLFYYNFLLSLSPKVLLAQLVRETPSLNIARFSVVIAHITRKVTSHILNNASKRAHALIHV